MSAPQLTVRRLGRDTLIYAAGTLVARLAAFIMLPVYTRVFTPRDYGVLQLLDMTVEMTATLLSVGMSSATMRSYFRATDESERARILANGWALMITLNLCGMLALLLAAPIIARTVLSGPELVGAVRVAAVGFAMSALPVVPLMFMQAQQRSSLFFLASVGKLIVQVGLNAYFLVGLHWGIIGMVSSTVVANLALGVPVSVWMLRETRLQLDWGAWRELARYAFPLQIGQVGMFILAFGDRYFLKSARDLSAVGIYSLAYQFGFLVSNLGATSFLQAWIPQRFQLASLPREQRDAEYGRGLTHYSVFLLTVCVGVSLFAPVMLTVLATPAYHSAARLVPLLALAYVVQGWTAAMHFSIDVSGKGEYSSYANWIAAGVIIVLYALLIPPFGPWGAALATLLGFLVRFACVYYWAQRLWPVSYVWHPSLRLLPLAMGAMTAGLALSTVGLGLQMLLSTILMATFVTAVWVSILTSESRAQIRQLVAKGIRNDRRGRAVTASRVAPHQRATPGNAPFLRRKSHQEIDTDPAPILFVSNGGNWIRGSERCLIDLALGIDRRRFFPVVICDAPVVRDVFREAGVPAHLSAGWGQTPQRLLPAAESVREIVQLIERYDIRLVHCNMVLPLKTVVVAARPRGIPVVSHLHIIHEWHERLSHWLHQASMSVGVSEAAIADLIEDGIKASRRRVIYNGVNVERMQIGSRPLLRTELGIPPDAVVVTSVGSLIHRKAMDVLLEAMARLPAGGTPAIHLLIVGEGPQRHEVVGLATRLQVLDRVHFLGEQSDVGAILRDATDIAATAARMEAFPLAVLEASYCALPVIASDIPPHREAVLDEITGQIVPLDDPAAFAAAIDEMARNPDRRAALGSAGRRRIQERFLVDHYVRAFEQLYTELLSRGPRRYRWIQGSAWPRAYWRWLRRAIRRRLPGTARGA